MNDIDNRLWYNKKISMRVILTFAFPFEFVHIYTYNGLGMNVNNWGNKNCERERELDKKPSLVGMQFFYRMHICPGCQRTWKRVCLGPLSA